MRALRTATLLIVLAVTGAAHADDAPSKVKVEETPLSAAEAEQLLAFFNELVDTVVKHAASCPALADGVDAVVSKHMRTIEMSWAAKKAKKTAPKEVQAQLDKRSSEMVGALKQCWNDAAVKKAFDRMKPPKPAKPGT